MSNLHCSQVHLANVQTVDSLRLRCQGALAFRPF